MPQYIMAGEAIQRNYPIPNLNFRDFWDVCRHYQRINPAYNEVTYTIDGFNNYVVVEESDISEILRKLARSKEKIREYVARFRATSHNEENELGPAELIYRPAGDDKHEVGLYFYSDTATKFGIFKFEEQIYSNYEIMDKLKPRVEFGKPCEVLTAVIDMRGFSAFCEQPNIESPYTCGLMTSFYDMVSYAFYKYPPELIKFAGDGVLAVWETSAEDREVAINVSIEGSTSLNSRWQIIRRSPHFSHGAPEDIGSGISFGLASKLSFSNDYIGRPINIASRLCGVCPGGRVYVDKALPSIPKDYVMKESRVRIKSFGMYNVWMLFSE